VRLPSEARRTGQIGRASQLLEDRTRLLPRELQLAAAEEGRRRLEAAREVGEVAGVVGIDLVRDEPLRLRDRIRYHLFRLDPELARDLLRESLPRRRIPRSLAVPRDTDALRLRLEWSGDGQGDDERGEHSGNSFLDRPKLRKVDRILTAHEGEEVVILRDPLGVAEAVSLGAAYAKVLDLLDGTRTPAQVRQSLLMKDGVDVHAGDLDGFVADLSEGGWLDDAAFRARWEGLHAAFLSADPRPPRFAGTLYPADPDELRSAFAKHLGDVDRVRVGSDVVGVLLPHGPPDLCGAVAAATLADLPAPEDVELVVVLGTDHGPGLTPYVATPKGFATPLGVVRNASDTFEALHRRVPWIDREEIRHRDALSIEIAVIHLQLAYGDACPPILPVLCGQAVLRGSSEAGHAGRFVAALESLCEDRSVLFFGSAELSHAGEAYGRPSLTESTARDVQTRDRACLEDLCAAREDALAARCRENHEQGRPSGGAVMTTLASLLPSRYRAEIAAYETRSVPGSAPGTVGLAGVRFRRPGPTPPSGRSERAR
jgi:AmmeMemoRadiSam system protein B